MRVRSNVSLDGWRWAGQGWGALSGKGSRGGTAPLGRTGGSDWGEMKREIKE